MRNDTEFIPIELWREAKRFMKEVNEDVEIYKIILQTGGLKPCEEAEKFSAYWNLESFENYPHALITLYEAKPEIDETFSVNDVMDSFECIQQRMKQYYLLLKQKGMIE